VSNSKLPELVKGWVLNTVLITLLVVAVASLPASGHVSERAGRRIAGTLWRHAALWRLPTVSRASVSRGNSDLLVVDHDVMPDTTHRIFLAVTGPHFPAEKNLQFLPKFHY